MAHRWSLLCVALVFTACKTAPPPPPPTPEIDFRQELRPYGQWLVVAPWGKVWAPNPDIVGKNFVPYVTGGQWVFTKKGWQFHSDYKFGDLVFHYGRWVHVQSLDWLWVEDKEWGPAWVDWKVASEYVGWAPKLPVATQGPPPAPPSFIFVRAREFPQPDVDKFRVTGDDQGKAVDQSTAYTAPAGQPPGPPVDLIVRERGLEKDAKGEYRVVELPPAAPAVEEAPAPAPEPEPAPPPPPPEKKKKKHKKHK